jgi:hypothetical protein
MKHSSFLSRISNTTFFLFRQNQISKQKMDAAEMLPNQTNGQPPGNAPKRGGAGSRRGRRSATGPANETQSAVGSPNEKTAAQSSSANGKVSRGGAANKRGVADGSPARGRGQGTPRRGGGQSQRAAGGGMDWRASPRGGVQAGHNTSRQTYSGPTAGGQGRRELYVRTQQCFLLNPFHILFLLQHTFLVIFPPKKLKSSVVDP